MKPSPITAQHCNPQCPGDGSGTFGFAADMTISVSIQITDDRNNQMTATGQVNVI